MTVFGLTVQLWLVPVLGFVWAWLAGYMGLAAHEEEPAAASFMYTLMSAVVLLLLLVLSVGVHTVARAVTGG